MRNFQRTLGKRPITRCIVSPHSNNAYKSTAPLVKIDISIKGGAFHMPEQKLTIVPVTLHSDTENISNIKRKPEIKNKRTK